MNAIAMIDLPEVNRMLTLRLNLRREIEVKRAEVAWLERELVIKYGMRKD